MGSARAPFRLTTKPASCFLHQPSAWSWACLSDNHHQTHIRVKDQWKGSIEHSSLTSGPSGS
eukprot:6004250-Amphidinium_carterae.1